MSVATSLLAPGERIELASLAQVGTVAIGKQVAVAAVAGVLSGGHLIVAVRPKTHYFVLTDQRLLFLEASEWAGRPTSRVVGLIPRSAIMAVSNARKGFLLKFDLVIAGQAKGLRLTFPPQRHADGERMARALGWGAQAGDDRAV